jgi:hypothetical protein
MLLRSSRRSLIAPLLGLALLAAAPAAYAAEDDDPEVVAQAKEHYKAGLEAYKAGKYDVAIRELKKAYLLKRLPPLLLNIGATYRKMGDLDLSLHFYQKFLDEAPADAKDRPEVEKIIGEIKKEKASGGGEKAGDEAAPPPSRSREGGSASDWKHDVIDAAPPDTPIDVRVQTAVMKGVKVFVYYRGSGQADFNSVLMKRRGREKVGRIPAQAVSGRSLQYYIEAKDSAGTVVKSSGSQANPNIIMVEDGVKPVMLASMSRRGEEEAEEQPADEEERAKKRKPSRDLDEESAPTSGKVDLTDSEPVRTPSRKPADGGMSPLMKAGIGLMAGGGALAIVGVAMLPLAAKTADTLSADSKAPVDSNNNPIFFNNDPNAGSTQESGLQSRGKTYNLVGIIGLSVGGAAVLAGASCMIADAVMKAEGSHPKKKHKKRRRVIEDEEDEEQSSNWYVAPSFGPSQVGVGGGFTF